MLLRPTYGAKAPVVLKRSSNMMPQTPAFTCGRSTKPTWRRQAAAVEGAFHISDQVILIGSGVVSLFGPLLYAELRGSK